MNNWPNELGGSHPLSAWGNKLLRAAKGSAIYPGRGYVVNRTTAGTVLDIDGGNAVQHPFKIYQASSWLKFKVSTGYVIATSDYFIPTSVDTELTITSGVEKFYFVLTILSASTGAITTSSTLPVWGVDVIPIGWVDTNTYSGSSASVIHQFLHDNVFSPCVT